MTVSDTNLDDKQQEAIDLSLSNDKRIVGITGPAGSGKTTIMRLIADGFFLLKNVALCAPTGKAARRIREATGIPAVTIHKLLEYNRPYERDEKGNTLDPTMPKRSRMNPLDQDVILVDEYAMVNYELHNNLIAALPRGGCIRAFGDVNQLPPIEPYRIKQPNNKTYKTPFQKILTEFPSVTLETIYRQRTGSNILIEANKIRQGLLPAINKDLGDFHLRITDQPVDLLKRVAVERDVDFSKLDNQIITSGRRSWVGTRKLNESLRLLLNPSPAHQLDLPRHKWDKDKLTIGLGDKVVCTENTYDLRDFEERFHSWNDDGTPHWPSYIPCPDTKMMLNGETGIVTQIYPDGGIDIDFGDRTVEVPHTHTEWWAKQDMIIDVYPLRNIDLAYALTTHKCQGSEFDNVLYIMNKSMMYTQNRSNFYTAVTRAKVNATILSDQRSVRQSLRPMVP